MRPDFQYSRASSAIRASFASRASLVSSIVRKSPFRAAAPMNTVSDSSEPY
uniref:Uncharacterized protein n=1 Tax=Escherichia coli TaxID=562 RepID=A0A7U1E1F7_ECOLX|nr:hypothetical protein [Escherichia coli]